jgi:hypothetical protein
VCWRQAGVSHRVQDPLEQQALHLSPGGVRVLSRREVRAHVCQAYGEGAHAPQPAGDELLQQECLQGCAGQRPLAQEYRPTVATRAHEPACGLLPPLHAPDRRLSNIRACGGLASSLEVVAKESGLSSTAPPPTADKLKEKQAAAAAAICDEAKKAKQTKQVSAQDHPCAPSSPSRPGPCGRMLTHGSALMPPPGAARSSRARRRGPAHCEVANLFSTSAPPLQGVLPPHRTPEVGARSRKKPFLPWAGRTQAHLRCAAAPN